ncbi:MAG: hypothetical protein AUI14_17530 [Actinobacteria bacterium 13_2_20CM_2_71_6]|nr:MAG: hypothetical protein AUI14_17530 [Actinobacteria bacterium 13_2_20CM_2_71_6]
MLAHCARLRHSLQQRHWQTYGTFCAQYDKVARSVDPELVGSWPSRAQFQRWLSGDLKGLPYPHHCRVLERMFPGLSAAELFTVVPLERSSGSGTPSTPATGSSEQLQLITSGVELNAAIIDVVANAREYIVAVGSRSREPAYLHEIELALERYSNLVHFRILIGPPHSQILKDHLIRLVELRAEQPARGNRKTLHISILVDVTNDHERFFVTSERSSVVVLPSANSPANFDTGLIIQDSSYVQSLGQHGRALYGKQRLETVDAISDLPVIR